jgi:hypothetical protein
MNTATIEVKATRPPKEGKKLHVVETTDDAVYMAWPNQIGLLRPGKTYEIQFSEDEFNGRTYKKIAKVKPAEQKQSSTPQQNGSGPKPDASNAEHDFVARTLAALIQACAVKVDRDGLASAVRMLRTVYRDTMI